MKRSEFVKLAARTLRSKGKKKLASAVVKYLQAQEGGFPWKKKTKAKAYALVGNIQVSVMKKGGAHRIHFGTYRQDRTDWDAADVMTKFGSMDEAEAGLMEILNAAKGGQVQMQWKKGWGMLLTFGKHKATVEPYIEDDEDYDDLIDSPGTNKRAAKQFVGDLKTLAQKVS